MNRRERAWAAHTEIMAIGTDAPHRRFARFGDIACVDMGVPHSWGVQSSPGLAEPPAADVSDALGWLRERGAAHGWQATVPEAHADNEVWAGLTVVDRIAVFATDADIAACIELVTTPGLTLDDEPPYDDVIAGYGGWMTDVPLARLLVVPTDLERADRRFIVGRVGGEVVGCAFVWFGGGTGYLSGIGVLPGLRGRGYGRALTAAAARLAAQNPEGRPSDLVWMHATDDGAALYARMGFERIDTEIALGAA